MGRNSGEEGMERWVQVVGGVARYGRSYVTLNSYYERCPETEVLTEWKGTGSARRSLEVLGMEECQPDRGEGAEGEVGVGAG